MGSVSLPTVRVEVGLSGPTTAADVFHVGDPIRGKVGVAKIGADDVWVDVTAYVRSWSLRRGASRGDGLNLRYEAGTCTVELNNGDRRFDPSNLSGPYASGGISSLQPMVRVRITAEWAGVAYPLITALADRWLPDYTTTTWSTTTLTATDAFKVFTAQDRTAGSPQGGGELSGARINRVLDSLGWPAEDRVIAAGDSTLQATTLEGNGITELQLVQDSELGELYIDAEGDVVFRNRNAILTEARSNTSQGSFGDAGIGTGEIPYAQAPVDNDDTTQANYISISNAGGTEQVAQDAASQARYLTKTYQRLDLLQETDAAALNYALALLGRAKDPELRFAQLQFNIPKPQVADDAWPQMLGRDFGDRITVVRRPPGGGTNTQDCFVRAVEHSSDGADWKTSWQLQSAARLQFFTVEHPTLGRIGSNALAF